MSQRFSRRTLGGLAVAGACLALAIVASAHAQANFKTYTDHQNRFTLQHPANWPVDVISRPTDVSYGVAIGVADAECKVFATPRMESAGKAPDAVRRAYLAPIGADQWKGASNDLNIWNDRGVVTANAVDTSKFWPVQTATFTTDSDKPGYAVMVARPGLDVWMFCNSFDNTDRKAVFDRIFASFAAPDDAALEAQGLAAEAARTAEKAKADADAAAAAEAAANRAAKQKKKR